MPMMTPPVMPGLNTTAPKGPSSQASEKTEGSWKFFSGPFFNYDKRAAGDSILNTGNAKIAADVLGLGFVVDWLAGKK